MATESMDPFGANEWLVEELYDLYKQDKNKVDPHWWEFFADYTPPSAAGARPLATTPSAPAAPPTAPVTPTTAAPAATASTGAPAVPASPKAADASAVVVALEKQLHEMKVYKVEWLR